MSLEVRIARVNAITAGGPDQDITVGGWSETPKAAIFVVTLNIDDDGNADSHAVLSFGLSDGSTHHVSTSTDEDNVGTSDSYRNWTSDEVIQIVSPAGAVWAEANFKAWIAGGVTITWGNLPANAVEVTVYFFTGTDLTVDVGNFTNSGIEDANADVDVGFVPDQVIFVSCCRALADEDNIGIHFIMSLGMAGNGGSIVQRGITVQARDNQPAADNYAYFSENRVSQFIVAGAIDTTIEITSIGSLAVGSGFIATTRDGTTQWITGYLALRYANQSHYIGTVTSPTGVGNDTNNNPGFKPRFVFVLGSLLEAVGVVDTTDQFSLMAGGFNASEEYCDVISSEDAEGTTDTQSISDQIAIHVPTDDGSDEIKATYVSMGASGYTLNWTDVLGVGTKFAALAVGVSIPVIILQHNHFKGGTI